MIREKSVRMKEKQKKMKMKRKEKGRRRTWIAVALLKSSFSQKNFTV